MKCYECLDVEACEDCEVGLCHCCCTCYECPSNVNHEGKKLMQGVHPALQPIKDLDMKELQPT